MLHFYPLSIFNIYNIFQEVHLHFLFFNFILIIILMADPTNNSDNNNLNIIIFGVIAICAITGLMLNAFHNPFPNPRPGIDQNDYKLSIFCLNLILDLLNSLNNESISPDEIGNRMIEIERFLKLTSSDTHFAIFSGLSSELHLSHDYFKNLEDVYKYLHYRIQEYYKVNRY